MLVAFSVENYRSFKDLVTFSMVAADLSSRPKDLDHTNVFLAHENLHLDLLTSAAVYGANAGGKSNLVAAIHFMRNLVLNSSRETRLRQPVAVSPFRLSSDTEHQPSRFEVVFVDRGEMYRYGFLVSQKQVEEEWLFATKAKKEGYLFERRLDTIKVNKRSFKEGMGLEDRTRPNALFLSVATQWNGKRAGQISGWFEKLIVNTGIDDQSMQRRLERLYEQADLAPEVIAFVKSLDLGIDDIQIEREDGREVSIRTSEGIVPSVTVEGPIRIRTVHTKYTSEGNPFTNELFDLFTQESQGTRRLFVLADPILRALRAGSVLVIDELDARLHPILTYQIIKLFNAPETNPKQAQLIFTTHDTNLLGSQLFRRDQIWFVEKSRRGVSTLYSLVEYRVRNDAAYEKNYIAGRYGAIPYLGDLSAAIGAINGEQEGDEAIFIEEGGEENDNSSLSAAFSGDTR